jgi:DNA-binding MarR family transcriptional regulator
VPSEDDMRLVHQLRALTVELNLAAAEFARCNDLHGTDVRALVCLLDAARDGTEATPGWLGKQLSLNSASTTALLDRLERAGHVQRDRDSGDRRRVLVSVTPQAVALGQTFFAPMFAGAADVMRRFSRAELSSIGCFLDEARAAMEAVRRDR